MVIPDEPKSSQAHAYLCPITIMTSRPRIPIQCAQLFDDHWSVSVAISFPSFVTYFNKYLQLCHVTCMLVTLFVSIFGNKT